jgi:muramidase (phage lysozyme)
MGKGRNKLSPRVAGYMGGFFDALDKKASGGARKILNTASGMTKSLNGVFNTHFQNLERYKVRAALLAVPIVAAMDLAHDLRRVMVESSDVMGDSYTRVAHTVNAMTASVSMSQNAAVRLIEKMSGLGILINQNDKDFVDFATHVGKLTETFNYNADAVLTNYANLSRLGVTMRGFIDYTKTAYEWGKRYNLSLRDQEAVMGQVNVHMAKMQLSGDDAAKGMVVQFTKVAGLFKALNVDISQAMQSLNEMSNFSQDEVIRKYARMASVTGRSVNELMGMYKNNIEEFAAVSMEGAFKYASGLARNQGESLGAMVDGTINHIAMSRLQDEMAKAFGADKVTALSTILAKTRTQLSEMESQYEALGRGAEFRANKEAFTQEVFDNQIKRMREQMAMEAEQRAQFSKFDDVYNSLKATTTEMLGSLKNIGHAILVIIGTPVLKFMHEIFKLVRPIIDGLAQGAIALSNMVSNSKVLQAVLVGLFAVAAGLLLPFLKIPILIGVAVKVLDELLKALGLGGVWGLLGEIWEGIKAIGSALYNVVLAPFRLISAAVGAVAELFGFSGDGIGASLEGVGSWIKKIGGWIGQLIMLPLRNITAIFRTISKIFAHPVEMVKLGVSYLRESFESFLSNVQMLGELITNLIWLPIKNTGKTLVWAVQKALSLIGMADDPGKLGLDKAKPLSEIGQAQVDRLSDIHKIYADSREENAMLLNGLRDTVKTESFLGREQQAKGLNGLTKEMQIANEGRVSEFSPYSRSGPERRLGAIDAVNAGGGGAASAAAAAGAAIAKASESSRAAVQPLPSGMAGLLEQIARGEGTDDLKAQKHGFASGYDVTLGYGKFNKPTDKPLSQMTLGEVKTLQKEILRNSGGLNSSAAGKYQIVGTTLRGLQKSMGLDDNTLFSPETQDAMAKKLLEGRGLNKYMSGQITRDQFHKNLVPEWASIADPRTGRALQHTGTSATAMAQALDGLKGSSAVTDTTSFAADTAARRARNAQVAALTPNRGSGAPTGPALDMRETNQRLDTLIDAQKSQAEENARWRQMALIANARGSNEQVTDMLSAGAV